MNRFYQLAILLLFVGLTWALLTIKCSKDKPAQPAVIVKIDTVLLDSKETTQKVKEITERNVFLEGVFQDITKQLNYRDNNIRSANKVNTQLANDLVEAKLHHDTVAFERICDSLGNAAVQWQVEYNSISDSAKRAFAIQKQIMNRKDSIIQLEENNRMRLITTLNEAKRAIQPRRKVYIGAEGYSTATAFNSLQAGVLLADKKSNVFGISAGFQTTGQAIFGAKYYHLLSLKK